VDRQFPFKLLVHRTGSSRVLREFFDSREQMQRAITTQYKKNHHIGDLQPRVWDQGEWIEDQETKAFLASSFVSDRQLLFAQISNLFKGLAIYEGEHLSSFQIAEVVEMVQAAFDAGDIPWNPEPQYEAFQRWEQDTKLPEEEVWKQLKS